jgi:hypothetical protein
MESVLRRVAADENVVAMTNLELARYTAGMNLAQITDRKVRNESNIALWFRVDGRIVCVQPGETYVMRG